MRHRLRMSRYLPLLGAAAASIVSCSSSSSAPGSALPDYVFQTSEFSIGPGVEKYQCFTKTVDEDMWVDEVDYESDKAVHHGVLVRTLAPEPDGTFECPVLSKTTWIPLFGNGVSNSKLTVPGGSSFAVAKGSQLLVQLHLLNPDTQDKTGKVLFRLHRTAKTASEAGIFAFGTTVISLPPKQVTPVQNDCVLQEDLAIFGVLPHMHQLGKTLVLLAGPDEAHLTEQFRVDPWDFGDQYVRQQPLSLKAGELTRTICTYDNTTDKVVGFGESTKDEMCFLPMFRTEYTGLAGCLDLSGWKTQGDGGAGAPAGDGGLMDPAACAKVTGNEKGIGAPCTKGGSECKTGLQCTADVNPSGTSTSGLCMQIGGCVTSADCGSGATCCAPAQAGGAINICVPEPCRPNDCNPVP